MAGDDVSDERTRTDVAMAVAMAKEAKERAVELATKFAIYEHIQERQETALSELRGGQQATLLAVTGMQGDLKWVREELSKKVDDTALNAADARRQAEHAKAEVEAAKAQTKGAKEAKESSSTARMISVIAMLVAVVAALVGVNF